ncbi:uncharacterized protein LOC108042570 [Drosophila rhopaloa]|uniref:Uncharacterized protein LOC108042570 n=1 Tax=Drosophila rhopaloa TaxID=1041015 RepID=A0A6P4EMY6_DRORH|nr:uncharacterized protein LOC108042570 [Drosophila rhopaloa]
MEPTYIIALLISIFCHCIGLFYNPVEASTESTVFLIVAIMFLHKLKLEYDPNFVQSHVGKALEVVVLCLAIQVLLVALWFPVFQTLKFIVDAICWKLLHSVSNEQAWIVEKLNNSAVTVVLLAMESTVLLKGFEIADVQKLFGSKDDCLSDSVLSFVAKEEKKAFRREKRRLENQRLLRKARA